LQPFEEFLRLKLKVLLEADRYEDAGKEKHREKARGLFRLYNLPGADSDHQPLD
jgi:hypothetical protein